MVRLMDNLMEFGHIAGLKQNKRYGIRKSKINNDME
jgi:hypothetical protein